MFRIYQWVNTVEYNGSKISQEDKDQIIQQLLSADKIEFKKLRKAIGKESAEFKFNYKELN
jgi:CRISPR-associated endonuclease Csn1